MYQLGIFNGKDLKKQTEDFLNFHFGKAGKYYYEVARGVHNSPVKPTRIPKSVGVERTFEKNLSSELFLVQKLETLADQLEKRLLKNKLSGKTVTLKIKYSDFKQQTRSKTGSLYLSNKDLILERVKDLLYQEEISNSVRLIGISLSNLNTLRLENKIKLPKKHSQLSLPF
jgi:DNA polymerase-4